MNRIVMSVILTVMVLAGGSAYGQAGSQWYFDLDGDGAWGGCGPGEPDLCVPSFGSPIDLPVTGFWSGMTVDFISLMGVFRNGQWFQDLSGNDGWDGCLTDGCLASFGLPTDLPVIGDWDGSGTSKVGTFRDGQWFFDLDGNGAWGGCGAGEPDFCVASFGLPGDIPVTGYWNGIGVDVISLIGVFRHGQWFLDLNGNDAWDGCEVDACYPSFGLPTDIPVTGDWDGSGVTRIGVFRNGEWFLDMNGNGAWDGCAVDACYPSFGLPTDIPVTGDWDGSGVTRIGTFRR